jgi:multiple sugar transport system permease protein
MQSRGWKFVAYCLLLFGAAVSLLPFFWMVRSALMTSSEIFQFPPKMLPDHWLWGNFIEIFEVVACAVLVLRAFSFQGKIFGLRSLLPR